VPLIKKLPFLSSQKSGGLVLWVDIPIYQLQFAETQARNMVKVGIENIYDFHFTFSILWHILICNKNILKVQFSSISNQ